MVPNLAKSRSPYQAWQPIACMGEMECFNQSLIASTLTIEWTDAAESSCEN